MSEIKLLAKAESYLNGIRNLDLEIEALEAARISYVGRRRDLLDQAENIGAALSGVCIQHPVGSKTENIGVQLADLPTLEEYVRKSNQYQARINRKMDELIDRKQAALDAIDLMRDARCRALIVNRYINNLRWPTIADMMGYNEHYVRIDLKWEAIGDFIKNWESPT